MSVDEKIEYGASLHYTGTQINYYQVCHRKLWLFSRGLNMEHTSDTVALGKLIHTEHYQREKKEIAIDDKIVIDFSGKTGVIHEIKKSRAVEAAHLWQLRYYLYYLKQKGITPVIGEINYPLLRRKERVELTAAIEMQLQKIFVEIDKILSRPAPQKITTKRSFCTKCSYFEYCWVD